MNEYCEYISSATMNPSVNHNVKNNLIHFGGTTYNEFTKAYLISTISLFKILLLLNYKITSIPSFPNSLLSQIL